MLPTSRRRVVGRDRVIRTLFDWMRSMQVTLVPMPVNAEPGALAYVDGALIAVISITVRDGVITHLHSVANPDKLAHVRAALARAPRAETDGQATLMRCSRSTTV
jgi:RNA polymerase sigma-70 factor (ECF subfamily)